MVATGPSSATDGRPSLRLIDSVVIDTRGVPVGPTRRSTSPELLRPMNTWSARLAAVCRSQLARHPARARALAIAAAMAFSSYWIAEAIPPLLQAFQHPPYDGVIDWGGARQMLAGKDPYSVESLLEIGLSPKFGLGHPPTTLIWFYPLAGLDRDGMRLVFTVLTLLMLVAHVGLVAHELKYPGWPWTPLLVSAAVFQTDWFKVHLMQVDLSELIAFLYALGWYFLRKRSDAAAGAAIGLACTLKLYPGVLVLFLVAGRRWRAVVGAAAAYVIFVLEVMRRLGLRGFAHFLEQTGSYADLWIADIRNASVMGIVHRLFVPVWSHAPRAVRTDATAIAAGISVLMLAGAWVVSRRHVRAASEPSNRPDQIDLPFALFSVLSMAPGPYQWEHYNVTLILPFMLLGRRVLSAATSPGGWTGRRATALLLGAVALLLDVSYDRRYYITAEARAGQAPISEVVFYELSAWLPWFLLSLFIGAILFVESRDERQHARETVAGAPAAAPASTS